MSTRLALLALYAVGLVAAGLFISRRVRAAGDFFVAGRQLPTGLVFTTLLAANIGAGSTVGAAGLAYRSEEHTSELQSQPNLVCRLLPDKKKNRYQPLQCLYHHFRG